MPTSPARGAPCHPNDEALATDKWRYNFFELARLGNSCAALVDPQRGGQTTLSASQVAAGCKRHRTVEFGAPYKRPMSSSGRLSVDMMMMMNKWCRPV
ncbi:jg5203 [Pararge aegeria aegeria]|uniref:Jg5203 protein n=1 Tax=Pararge aegeria aegeria TaxID=348720 RepID=A0A8S4QU11_9NEOP|nr:jg5203 [Pararge aegeria aegeria]